MTYQELQQYVTERLGIDSSDSSRSTLIQRVINGEYTRACIESEATLTTATMSFVAATPTVTLGATVEKVKAIFTSSGRLTPVSPSRFAFLAGKYTTSGDYPTAPAYYIVYQDGADIKIRLWPTPAGNDTSPLAFVVVTPTALSANGDEPSGIPSAWHHAVIGERAVQRVALAEESLELAAEAGRLADMGMMELVQHVRERNGELDAPLAVFGDVGVTTGQAFGQVAQ